MATIPDLELKILSILWNHDDGLKVQEIIDRWQTLPPPGYTTILKKLQVMGEKRLIGHTREGKAYRYKALISKNEVSERRFGGILSDFFAGDKLEMANAFFRDTSFTQKELEDVKRLIDQLEGRSDD